jgi:hypothetical protein
VVKRWVGRTIKRNAIGHRQNLVYTFSQWSVRQLFVVKRLSILPIGQEL